MNTDKISKKVADILTTASPRQKALLICRDWTDRKTMQKTPLITDAEAAAIKDSIKTDEEKREFKRWIHHYNVFHEMTQLIGLVYKEYQTQAERVLGFLKVWDSYSQEENHLNTICQGLKQSGNKEGLQTFYDTLCFLSLDGARIKIDKEGFIDIDITELYDIIGREVNILKANYEAAKAIVIAMEEYVRRTRSRAFIPELTLQAIEDIQEDYALNVAPKYSRKCLSDKINSGVRVSPEEVKRAVYPNYAEIDPSEELVEMFRERFKNANKNAE